MAAIVICGGSVIGLATAMLLAREGHDVTVLESDPAPVPAEPAGAWERWERKGVAQFHQPHNLFARARHILDADLPGITEGLVDAGGTWLDPAGALPPTLFDRSPDPDDDRFRFVNTRRPVMETVFAHAAAGHDQVTVRRGVAVAGLRVAPPGPNGASPPHVTGVRLDGGEEVAADLVVDAMGRRTRLPEWLAAIGTRPPHVESEDSGFVYYTRFYRGPAHPELLAPALSSLGPISVLTLKSDNVTWSVTAFTASADTDLRGLRDPERFERVVRACPLQTHWVDAEPITGMEVMAGVLDRYRRYVVDGEPVVTGVVPVGDAWACTNPSAGRGISVGLVQAQRLRDAVREGLDDPEAFIRRYDAATEADVTPFYRNQIAADRARIAEMHALREGTEPPAPDPMMAAIGAATVREPDVFRGMLEVVTCLAQPQDVFARPALRAKIAGYVGQAPPPPPGPTRAELVALLR